MINPANNAQTNVAQYYTNLTNLKSPKKLSDGKPLQVCGEEQLSQDTKRYDTLTLTQNQGGETLNVADKITIEKPRRRTIMGETFDEINKSIQASLEKADKLKLSFFDRLTFLHKEREKWVEDKRQNDPEMFAPYLKSHEYFILRGEGSLIGLSDDFTTDDYNFYINEYLS